MTRRRRIYLDYNASSPVRPEALEACRRAMAKIASNASSLHAEGRAARHILETARERVAEAVGAAASEIVFTSGGTEADDLALRGALEAARRARPHVVTTTIEHPAVLEPLARAEAEGALRVTRVPCDRHGRVRADDVEAAIRRDTVLISVMLANNEVGMIQPVASIARAAATRGVPVHTDAVQGLGRIPVDVRRLGVSLMSLSAHKLGGPKGIGALYVRKGTALQSRLLGGEQERGRRAGTENVAGAAGFAAAVDAALATRESEAARLAGLKRSLWERLEGRVPGVVLNGSLTDSLPNTLNVSFDDISSEDLMMAMDLDGIAVSTGSACAVGAAKPSHVLAAMYPSGAPGCGPLRISMGFETREDDVTAAVRTIVGIVGRLRSRGQRCRCSKGTCCR